MENYTYKKDLIIIAGVNGSGKTTFAKEFLKSFNYEFINADEIAKKLNPENIAKARIVAGKMFLKEIEKSKNYGKSFIIETTLSGKYTERIIRKLKQENYSIIIIYIFLESSKLCINRVKDRQLKGGHFIPNEDIIRRFNRSNKNFWRTYRYLVDNWILFNNTDKNFEETAFGIKSDFTIVNKASFKTFIKGV